nr:MAG TPA: hypothetical protein [Caudoviricetes sp.]
MLYTIAKQKSTLKQIFLHSIEYFYSISYN